MANSAPDEQRINTIRFLAVDAIQKANSGHPGMPLGAAAAAYTLWDRHLRHDPADPHWFGRDRFVLSAGHASMLLYALLHLYGYDLSLDDIKAFRQLGSRTPGHPEVHHTAGVEVTTGPLGQGFANAVGLAIAQAHLAATYAAGTNLFDHHTYVMAGDGDMMEGVAAEAASLAGHLALGNLICLYDDNRVSLAGPTNVTFTEDVGARFAAYGWHVSHVDAEHANDVAAIDAAISAAKAVSDKPSIILIRSTIGYGSPRAGSSAAHGEPLGAENTAKTKAALDWPLEPTFLIPDDVASHFAARKASASAEHAAWNEAYTRWKHAHPELAANFERALAGQLPTTLNLPEFTAENGSIASRDAGGIVMNALAASLPELIGGSADLDPSTKTYLKDKGNFAPGAYAGRNVHFGVREHAMAAAMNGIALHGGLLPFCATFFTFLDYLKPSLRLAALNSVRSIYVFTHDSILLGEDGPTHQPIEHLAMLRAIPNVVDIRPADALETLEAWKLAVQPNAGPTAIVLSRQKLPFLGTRNAAVARGAYVLREASGSIDVILIASGSEVALALEAADLLEAAGTHARVVSMPSWALFEQQDAAYHESILPAAVGARVSIEAGATIGWHKFVGARGIAFGIDRFGTSAPAGDIAANYGFTPQNIATLASGLVATHT